MAQYVLNGSFSTPDIASNTSNTYKDFVATNGSINNWSFSGTGGRVMIIDGSTAFNSYVNTSNQALLLQDLSNNTSNKATQSIYFTKGTYNLQLRTLYRSVLYNNSHSLTVSISNGVNTVLSKILDGSKTEMDKINVVSAASDWIDTDYTKSLKTYGFTVNTDGSYNLTFETAFPYTSGTTADSTIFLTNVVVKKDSYVLNGNFSIPDISYNTQHYSSYPPSWNITLQGPTVPVVSVLDGTGSFTDFYFPAGKQGVVVRQTGVGLCTLSQDIYFTQGFYNLSFRALYRAGKAGQSLFVDICNNNYTALTTKRLNATLTGMNQLYGYYTTNWKTNESYKSYDFKVSSDGSYTLLFTYTADSTIRSNNNSTIVLTDVVIEPQLPKPWGVYIAGHPNNTVNRSLQNVSGTLFDITGQGRHAVIGGGFDAIFASGSGNGAVATVPYIQGFKNTLKNTGINSGTTGADGSGTQIIWPSDSIPATNFTLSSITRYTNSVNAKRILTCVDINMAHGHWGGYPGHNFYAGTWKTTLSSANPSSSNIIDPSNYWCITCATTNTNVTYPYNVLVNNVAKGFRTGVNTSSGQLAINRASSTISNEQSDFAFQQLVIWDVGLDADQLLRISTLQNNYLQTGTIQYPFAIISTPPVITSVTNSPVVNQKTNFSINFTIAAVGALDASFTYLYSTDGGQTFTDSLQIESPITINNLNEDQSYQFVIKHRSTAGYSEPSNIMTAIAKYPCFLEGSRILRMNVDTYDEEYVAIETLREGDLIKTSCSGYVPIKHIGYKTIPNPTDDPNKRNRLYRFPKSISRQMIADLYITGEHCVLYKDLSDALKEKVYNHMGDIYITEESYRVPACLDERAVPYKGEGPVTIWHFALENPDVTHNYGVYANGLLVESCSIKYLSELSKMKLR